MVPQVQRQGVHSHTKWLAGLSGLLCWTPPRLGSRRRPAELGGNPTQLGARERGRTSLAGASDQPCRSAGFLAMRSSAAMRSSSLARSSPNRSVPGLKTTPCLMVKGPLGPSTLMGLVQHQGSIGLTLKSIEKFSFGHHGSRSLLTVPQSTCLIDCRTEGFVRPMSCFLAVISLKGCRMRFIQSPHRN
jgi:hypothetical protein